jgi:hypothetical protein
VEWIVFLGLLAVASAVVGAAVGSYVSDAKGRGLTEGAVLGGLLGLFGVLIVALLPNRLRPEGEARRPLRSELDEDEEEEKASAFLGGISPPPVKDEVNRGLRIDPGPINLRD